MNSDERRITFKISEDLNTAMRERIEKRHGTLKALVLKSVKHGLLRCEDDDFLHLIHFATPRARNSIQLDRIAVHLPSEVVNKIDRLVPVLGSDRAQFIETSILSYCTNNYEAFNLNRDYPMMYFSRLKRDSSEYLDKIGSSY